MNVEWKKKTIVFLVFILFTAAPVYAHPGRTDANGGHRDNQNASGLGYYHYHCGGHPPHLHENGICPYNTSASYVEEPQESYSSSDTPSSSSSTSNSSSSYSSSRTRAATEPVEDETEAVSEEPVETTSNPSSEEESDDSSLWFPMLVLSALFLTAVFMLKKEPASKWKARQKEEKDYDYYFSCYAFYKPEDFVKIPAGTYIRCGLPYSKGSGKYGAYTVYTTPTGSCYHTNRNCARSSNLQENNIVSISILYRPCSRCVKKKLDLTWYREYSRIKKIKEKYMIP